MKTNWFMAGCIAAVMGMFSGSLMAQGPAYAAPREVLVQFTSHVPSFVQDLVREHDLELVKGIGGAGAMRLRSRTKDTDTLIRALSQRPDVRFVEPNYIVTRQNTPSDPYWSQLWGMVKISAPSAWDTTTGTSNIVVGVVDTGIDYNHPDLAQNIWSSSSQFSVTIGGATITCPAGAHGFNAITNTCDPMDDENHGTHVSGTIGAVANNGQGVVGVNWSTSLVGLKFLNAQGSGYTSDAIDAIEFAVQLKKTLGVNLRVLNNSWGGGGYSQALYDEIQRAGQNGILFVAAAGNSGVNTDTKPSYPASYNLPNIIAVAATDSNDTLASWSNYGATSVDLAAPGVNILSTIRNQSYATYSGTSMATPHVTGAAALVLSAPSCTGLTTDQVKAAILNNVDLVPGLAGKVLTGGRLNVSKAIANCTAPPTSDFALSVTPASATVRQGKKTQYTVAVTPQGGFNGTVSLSVSGCPSGASCTLTPSSITGSGTSALNITTTRSTPTGNYTVTITGSSGSLSHSVSATLTVTR